MNFEMYDDAKKIKLEELPELIQQKLLDYGYVEPIEEDEEDDDYYDEDDQEIRFFSYPKDMPIIVSSFLLDGGMEVNNYAFFTHNLEKKLSLDFYATSAKYYEKINPDETSYIIMRVSYRNDVDWYLVIEI